MHADPHFFLLPASSRDVRSWQMVKDAGEHRTPHSSRLPRTRTASCSKLNFSNSLQIPPVAQSRLRPPAPTMKKVDLDDIEMVDRSKKGGGTHRAANGEQSTAGAGGSCGPTTVALLFLGAAALAVSLATLVVVAASVLPQIDVLSSQLANTTSNPAEDNSGCEASLGLPGLESLTWSAITARAATQQLQFYLYNYGPTDWFVNDVMAPRLKEAFRINVVMQDAAYSGCGLDGSNMAVICQVQDQVDAGEVGTVDLIWINKVNFKVMKDRGLLYGPWATQIPAAANFDFTSSAISYDAGTAIDGMEFPFNIAQAVFIRNKAHVADDDMPTTIPELTSWCQANPGRMQYSDATLDFTGAAFVRQFFHHYTTSLGHKWGEFLDLPGTGESALYAEVSAAVWAALLDLETCLYQPGTYPASHNLDIRPLVSNETLWIDFSMQASEATNQQDAGVNPWPLTTDACVQLYGCVVSRRVGVRRLVSAATHAPCTHSSLLTPHPSLSWREVASCAWFAGSQQRRPLVIGMQVRAWHRHAR